MLAVAVSWRRERSSTSANLRLICTLSPRLICTRSPLTATNTSSLYRSPSLKSWTVTSSSPEGVLVVLVSSLLVAICLFPPLSRLYAAVNVLVVSMRIM